MTRTDAVNWLNSQKGKFLDYDNAYGIQCFDLYNYYYVYITGRNPYSDGYGVPSAKDIWGVPTSLFTKVANNTNDANQIPAVGDVLVYNSRWGGGDGHVEMVVGVDTKGFTAIGQRQSEANRSATAVYRSWATVAGGLIGWLSFNGFKENVQVASNQRVVGANGVNCRDRANVAGAIVKEGVAGEVLTFKGYVVGENVSGNNKWFVGFYSGVYCWSGAFTDSSTAGLNDITPQAPVVVPPPPVVSTLDKVIDVSAHNTITDYATVINNVRGAIAKAGHTGKSYGGNAINGDPKFLDFKKNFGNKLVGAYWYAYCSLDPITEADNFIKAVGDVPADFTYWLDIEETNDQTNAQINEWCVKFAGEVDKLTGRVCGLYMNRNWFNNYITADTKGARPIWLAHYDTSAFADPVANQVAHQYTSTGKVTGYAGNLDLNHVKDLFFKPTVIEKPVPPVIPEPPVVPEKPLPDTPVPPPDVLPTTLYDTILGFVKIIIEWLKGWKK